MRSKIIITIIMLITAVTTLTSITACRKGSKNPVGPDNSISEFMWVHFKGDSTKVKYDDLTVFDINTISKRVASENDAIWLKAFIDTSLIPVTIARDESVHDTRNLYSFRFKGDDGYGAYKKGYADNTWNQLDKGYVLLATRRIIFPDELLDLPGAYNVRDVRSVHISRKFEVVNPDSAAFVRLQDIASVKINNWDGVPEDALCLAEMVKAVLVNPENYHYNIEAIDGYSLPADLTWTELQTGYWLINSAKTLFTNPALASGKYKVKKLLKIVVKN